MSLGRPWCSKEEFSQKVKTSAIRTIICLTFIARQRTSHEPTLIADTMNAHDGWGYRREISRKGHEVADVHVK